jgi:hypothetical protein
VHCPCDVHLDLSRSGQLRDEFGRGRGAISVSGSVIACVAPEPIAALNTRIGVPRVPTPAAAPVKPTRAPLTWIAPVDGVEQLIISFAPNGYGPCCDTSALVAVIAPVLGMATEAPIDEIEPCPGT